MENTKLTEFLILGRSTTGAAAAGLIRQVLDQPGLFTFSELLLLPNIVALETTTHKPYLELLRIFSYGTYLDYKTAAGSLPQLSEAQTTKLKQLTIVTLAKKQKQLSYETILQQLDVPNVRVLEDLIIDAIYQGLIRGKLDQKARALEIENTMGRDLHPGELEQIIGVLEHWHSRTEEVLTRIDLNIQYVTETVLRLEKESEVFESEQDRAKVRLAKRSESDDRRGGPVGDFSSQEYYDEDNRSKGGNKSRSKFTGKSNPMSASSSTRRGPQRP